MKYRDKLDELHLDFLKKFQLYSEASVQMARAASIGGSDLKLLEVKRISAYDAFHESFRRHSILNMYVMNNKIDPETEFRDHNLF